MKYSDPRFLFLLLSLAVASAFSPGPAHAADFGDTLAKQAIVLDYDTGAVLYEKNADERMAPSSMSKEMTMYLVFEAIRSGRLTMEQQLGVSEKAWRIQGSEMFLPLNGQARVEDLIRGVVIQSGNDAAIVFAEGLSGSEEAFARELNKKAAELGMKNSHFVNASGWPDPDHYSTARDLSTLAMHIIHDFPEHYHYYAEKEFTYGGIKQGNRNPLLYRNVGGDGIKTGHTEDGGYGLMGSGTQNGRRVVFVLNGMPSMQARADESARILEWALKNFENVKFVSKGETIEQADVALGKEKKVPLVVDQDVVATLPYGANGTAKMTISYNSPLIAPIKAGQEVGTLSVTMPNGEARRITLKTGADVEELGFFKGTIAKLGYRLN